MPGPTIGDAFGEAFLAHVEGGDGTHVIERDDGFVESFDAAAYFTGPDDWPEPVTRLLERARGAVLDVGAGAGRHSLALRERGLTVTALDPSPAAVEVCRRRGLDDTFLGTVHDLEDGGPYDTFLLLGGNLGLIESPVEAPRFLGRLRDLAAPGAQILGSGIDPYRTENPLHFAYHERNRAAGRPGGQITLRIRFRNTATSWFEIWWVTPAELGEILATADTGWNLTDHGQGPTYWAILDAI